MFQNEGCFVDFSFHADALFHHDFSSRASTAYFAKHLDLALTPAGHLLVSNLARGPEIVNARASHHRGIGTIARALL